MPLGIEIACLNTLGGNSFIVVWTYDLIEIGLAAFISFQNTTRLVNTSVARELPFIWPVAFSWNESRPEHGDRKK